MEVLSTGRLSWGPMLRQFEEEFAARLGRRHAVGVSSGSTALHLALIAAGIGEGDLVITTPFSFVASANSILWQRAIPVFVDVDPDDLNIDPERVEEAIEVLSNRKQGWQSLLPPAVSSVTGSLKAVLPVHVFGRPAEMVSIGRAAKHAGLVVIEDACEAIGATRNGKFAGAFGNAAVFGFYPNKQMTTGEGGMVVTDDAEWATLFRSLRNQGRNDGAAWLEHERLGYNYRLDEISAALGVAQLRRLDEILGLRNDVAQTYDRLLADVDGVAVPAPPRPGTSTSWFVYTVRLALDIDRTRLIEALQRRGVETRPYFPAIHLQPLYTRELGFERGMYPHAEAAGDSLLALPFYTRLTRDDIEYVTTAVREESANLRGSSLRDSA